MKLLLSLIALFGVIAIADIAVSPSANATTLSTSVNTLKGEHQSVAEQVRYRCWWRYGRRHCRWVGPWRGHRHCWWRHGRRVCRW
jgi:hypothetical protein